MLEIWTWYSRERGERHRTLRKEHRSDPEERCGRGKVGWGGGSRGQQYPQTVVVQRCGTAACAAWVMWKAAAMQACGPHPGCISYPPLKQPLERPTLSFHVKRTHSLPAGSADLRTWLQLPDWLTGRVKHCRGVCRPRSERHRVASICVSMEAFPARRTQVNKS